MRRRSACRLQHPLLTGWTAARKRRHESIDAAASRIECLIQGSDYSSCWLAAPKENHQIVHELTPPVCQRIKRAIPCDLTKASRKELLDQFLNPTSGLSERECECRFH